MLLKNLLIVCLFIIFLFCTSCKAQSGDTIFVAFWNMENLFDTIDDSSINDESFLPDGDMEWTQDRLDKKMYNLARVIRMMNDYRGPDLLGVCEVENEAILAEMVKRFLPDSFYGIAYLESPDNRGIDNGLLFKKEKFKLLNVQADTVHLMAGWPTRLIFGANLLTIDNKKITVFVNHWPSRRGGQEQSEPNRNAAARTLRNSVDRILEADINANILIIGDFNDDPINNSLIETLMAHPVKCDTIKADYEFDSVGKLFNLAYEAFERGEGSFKYRDNWNMLDQIIISHSLLVGNDMNYICSSFEVFMPEIMVTKSGKFEGAPFPSYGGGRYLGGYSDHFPVLSKFKIIRSSD